MRQSLYRGEEDPSPAPNRAFVEAAATDIQAGACPSDTQVMRSGGEKSLNKRVLVASALLP